MERIDECSNLCNESKLMQDSHPLSSLANPLNSQSFHKYSIIKGLVIQQLESRIKLSRSFILSKNISINNLQKLCKVKITIDLVHSLLP